MFAVWYYIEYCQHEQYDSLLTFEREREWIDRQINRQTDRQIATLM